jgi:hypothetical protein
MGAATGGHSAVVQIVQAVKLSNQFFSTKYRFFVAILSKS